MVAMDIQTFVEVSEAGVETYVRTRIELVIGRFAERIARVHTHVSQETSHECNEHYLCTCEIKLASHGLIYVSAKHATVEGAVLRAVHRAETALAKTIDRGYRARRVRHNGGGLRHLSENLDAIAPLCEKTSDRLSIAESKREDPT